MSQTFLQPPKITRQSFLNTICTDQQVFRWFLYLVVKPAVKSELSADKSVQTEYQKLERLRPMQRLAYGSILMVIVFVILSQDYRWVATLIPLWCALLFIERPLRRAVANISLNMVDQIWDEKTFSQQTLYQIGQHLAQNYEVHSLVDGIAFTDSLLRKWLVISAFLVIFMFVMSFWRGGAMIFMLYFIGNIVINAEPIYQRYVK